MADNDLPPGLRDLEARLASRPGPDAGEAKARVLGAVRQELMATAHRKPLSLWRFAAAAAAVVLVWVNLSISAVNCTDVRLRPNGNHWDEQAAVAEIRELLPDCPVEEARRQALLLRARAQLVSAPELRHAPPGAGEGL